MEEGMKYLLVLQVRTAVLERFTAEEREAVQAGHRELQRITTEAGELISTESLADPSTSTVVRNQAVSVGPFRAADEYMGGYYLVDVDDLDRAVELARILPAGRIDGLAVEIRPVMVTAATDL
jgi:hypothetical protein